MVQISSLENFIRKSIWQLTRQGDIQKYNSETLSLSPQLAVRYEIEELLTVAPSYQLTYNKASYSLDSMTLARTLPGDIPCLWLAMLIADSRYSYTTC